MIPPNTGILANMQLAINRSPDKNCCKFFLPMCVCQSLEQLDLEETKKDLINREIRSFRDAHKVNSC